MDDIFNIAVRLIAEAFEDDKKDLDADTLADVFKCYKYDNEDIKRECLYILRHSPEFDSGNVTDECEIIDNNKIYPFIKLKKAIITK